MGLSCLLRRRCFGQSRFVAFEPATEDFNGTAEVVAEFDEQKDVVDVPRTGEAVGEVVARVDRGLHFAAAGARKDEVGFALF